ncbi:FHA domain-containing protein [Acidaminococcus massiliensis]|uniref:FHA domain-containing protein n=1 Tax=Acidaminococcus massiliensis TaxID=1852375 RepID=UPI00248F19C8|nr:FHA domain-containing protein [Acidaminococcus massiliensis]
MDQWKICPACGAKNSPGSMECLSCGYDLMSTPVVSAEIEKVEPSSGAETASVSEPFPSDYVKICPCGAVNPPQARKCLQCHEDISDVLPIKKPQIEGDQEERLFQLKDPVTGIQYPLKAGVTIIGREAQFRDLLQSHSYVSRIHAKLILEEGKCFIENLSHTNYTFVNNQRIPEGRFELRPGDLIGLGGIKVDGNFQEEAAYFILEVLA